MLGGEGQEGEITLTVSTDEYGEHGRQWHVG